MDENASVGNGPANRAGGIRASDTEREDTAEVIRTAASEGRLTLVELEDRLSSVYAARMREELSPLVADLPVARQEPVDRQRPGRLTAGGRTALTVHAVLVVVFAVAVVSRWVATGMVFFWPVFPIFWAMLTLLIHARIRGALPSRAR